MIEIDNQKIDLASLIIGSNCFQPNFKKFFLFIKMWFTMFFDMKIRSKGSVQDMV